MQIITFALKKFVTDQPLLFAIGVTVLGGFVEFLAFSAGELVGLPESALTLIALLVSTAIPLSFISLLGWWKDAGFVTTTHNVFALTVPFVLAFIFLPFFGTVAMEPKLSLFILVIFFLTGLSEEALSRGLLLRVFLPQGKWPAVLIPSVLFGVAHIVQLAQGMEISANLLQITNAIIFGVLYATVRLRVNSIWPLIVIHMLFDVFVAISGTFGPAATHTINDIPWLMWVLIWTPSLVTAFYLIRKPATATIDGKSVG